MSSKRVFVGGLAWATGDDELRAAFEEFGNVVDAKVITDRDTGRSRGYGFVTFGEVEEAMAAIEGMNGAALNGRILRVNEAESASPRKKVHTQGSRSRPAKAPPEPVVVHRPSRKSRKVYDLSSADG